MVKLLMLHLQQRVEQAKFLHHAERSSMNGVAAEVAVEVLMLFEHDNIDRPGARGVERERRRQVLRLRYRLRCEELHSSISAGEACFWRGRELLGYILARTSWSPSPLHHRHPNSDPPAPGRGTAKDCI